MLQCLIYIFLKWFFLTYCSANPKVPDMTPEDFDQVYLSNSKRFMDDIILIHSSHLGGGVENENVWFQILPMNL